MATTTPALGTAAVNVMKALQACPEIHYSLGADLVDNNGTVLSDLSAAIVTDQTAEVRRDCAADIPGALTLSLNTRLVWGLDIIAPYSLVRAPAYANGDWQRFNLGHYVATSPTTSLRANAVQDIIGYDKNYLLTGDIGDTFLLASGATYTSGVARALSAAGFPSALVSGELAAAYVSFPGDLTSKTTPINMIFPCDDSNVFTYLQVINEMLKAAACRPIYPDQNGRFTIEYLPKPVSQPQRWVFSGSASSFDPAFPANSVVDEVERTISRDVFGIPNQWVFVQQGLTFAPVAGSGLYTVDNKVGSAIYQTPSDQDTIKRVIKTVQYLSATNQTDLQKQGDAIVTAQLSQADRISLKTAPWPCAWHYDIFQYADSALPDNSPVRKVQAQQWTLPLKGELMDWTTLVVAPQ